MIEILQTTDWRSLDRETLGRAYNNAEAVAGSADILADWEARSAAVRQSRGTELDLRYGPRERNRIDFLLARKGAPTLVFVHGGYWQMRAKETFAFLAEGPLARGISVALIGYTLAPEATLAEMITEIRAALDFLSEQLPRLGGNTERVWLCGWSAGAHLAVSVMDHPMVTRCLAISGLYHLEPLRHCWINDKLGLDEEAAERASPILNMPRRAVPTVVAWGGAELPLMRRQSDAYATVCHEEGMEITAYEIEDRNHFTILEEMASPLGYLATLVAEMR